MPTDYAAVYGAVLAKWPVPVTGTEVPGRFGTTRVNACGPVGAPAIVLMPGGGASSAVWLHNVAGLSAHHRVYAVDGMGSAGLSVFDGARIASTADMAEWLDGLLDHLDAPDAVFVGHSYGAWVCLRYALDRPARVRRLVLLDPTGCVSGQRLGYRLRGIRAVLGLGRDPMRRLIAWETGGRPIDADWLDLMCATRPGREPFRWPVRPSRREFAGFAVPTTVVVADRSKAENPRRLAAGTRRLLPHARIVELPDATHHTIPTEHAEEINAAILAGNGPERTTGASGSRKRPPTK